MDLLGIGNAVVILLIFGDIRRMVYEVARIVIETEFVRFIFLSAHDAHIAVHKEVRARLLSEPRCKHSRSVLSHPDLPRKGTHVHGYVRFRRTVV